MKVSSQAQKNNHQQVLYRLEEYFDSIDKAAYSMCYAPTTQAYIQANFEDRISQKSNLVSIYSSTYLLLDSLIGIAVFDEEGNYIASNGANIYHLEGLSDELKEVAYIRREHPEYNLRELGQALKVPISRSGVNHRLQRLMMIAEELQSQ